MEGSESSVHDFRIFGRFQLISRGFRGLFRLIFRGFEPILVYFGSNGPISAQNQGFLTYLGLFWLISRAFFILFWAYFGSFPGGLSQFWSILGPMDLFRLIFRGFEPIWAYFGLIWGFGPTLGSLGPILDHFRWVWAYFGENWGNFGSYSGVLAIV